MFSVLGGLHFRGPHRLQDRMTGWCIFGPVLRKIYPNNLPFCLPASSSFAICTMPKPPAGSRDTDESWARHLDKFDEAISRPIFQLGLPTWVEFVVSIPANCFGTTACLAVGPLWIALLEAWDQQERGLIHPPDVARVAQLQCLVVSMTLGYLAAWGYLQIADGYWLGKTLFWNKLLYVLACPWVVAVLATTVGKLPRENAKTIVSQAVYPLCLFPVVLVLMTYLKALTRRQRPARKDLARGGVWLVKKRFPTNTCFLARHSGDQSYPSGDVMLAVLVALPLWSRRPRLAAAIAVSSGLGRMYVLAHHLGDVLSGALCTLGIHRTAALLGYDTHRAELWHPLIPLAAFVAFQRWTKKDLGAAIPDDK